MSEDEFNAIAFWLDAKSGLVNITDMGLNLLDKDGFERRVEISNPYLSHFISKHFRDSQTRLAQDAFPTEKKNIRAQVPPLARFDALLEAYGVSGKGQRKIVSYVEFSVAPVPADDAVF